MKVLLLENIHPVAKQMFLEQGFQVHESCETMSEYDIICVRSKTKLKTFGKNVKAIGCFCIGTDQVDLQEATKQGIPVFNSPFSNTRSVAELTICEIIALSRKLMVRNNELHHHYWNKTASNCHEVRGKTLGIIGFGHVGSQVSILAESMGMNVLFYDIEHKLSIGNAKSCSMEQLLSQSDFVTLHVPLTEKTKNMISVKELNLMKKGSYLLNLSRGEVVDLHALKLALIENQLLGCSLDVFPIEPEKNGIYHNELQGMENVILTPHIGGSTEEAQEAIGVDVASKLIQFVTTGKISNSVNFPSVHLDLTNKKRIVHVHQNIPGVLKKVHSCITSNIHSEMLNTNQEIGYLIMDVDDCEIESIVKLPETIKVYLIENGKMVC